jgi:hypothetical protein
MCETTKENPLIGYFRLVKVSHYIICDEKLSLWSICSEYYWLRWVARDGDNAGDSHDIDCAAQLQMSESALGI